MNLWPHQARGLEQTAAAIQAGARRICFTSPTGGGKSLCIFSRIEAEPSSALYTDRRMLLTQTERGLERHGIPFGIRAAGYEPRLLDDVQLCMVQTEASKCLKGNRSVHRCRQVLVDEAHKNAADSMCSLWEAHQDSHQDPVLIGFTATPLGIGHLYDHLIVAGTNSELRKCGALVPAYHYGPDEPDTKWVGKIAVGEGECGLSQDKRREFAHRVFGRVVENYRALNPEQLPTVLFAPGVKESIWFAKTLTKKGIPSAHIDGNNCWLDGEEIQNNESVRDEILERSKSGDIKIICNRFVLREGIDAPWFRHGIFATVFGSLTSYLQAGGRLLRASEGKDCCTIQDHGGNWHRHGSLNEDRQWELSYTDRIVAGLREQRLREKKDPEPIVCPKCSSVRLSGPACRQCGYRHETKTRMVVQRDGSLREMKGDIYRKRRVMSHSEQIETEWRGRVRAIRRSKKATVQRMTFAQLEATFARDHKWSYPPRSLEGMPIQDADWYRPIRDVPEECLR